MLQHRNLNYVGIGATIRDGLFENYEITREPNFDNIKFDGCVFSSIEINDMSATGPKIVDCQIDAVYGAIGTNDIPPALKASETGISKFVDEARTNADILDLPIPLSVKVLMTVLRKLFVQAGRGRKENAFYRGLDARAKAYVPEILTLVWQLHFASPQKISGPTVWFPNRSRARDVHEILSSPQQSLQPLVVRARSL